MASSKEDNVEKISVKIIDLFQIAEILIYVH